jgi:hypothetical protein
MTVRQSDSIRRRIAALLNKTTTRGCTEAEAATAAEMAARLMAKHGLAEADLVMGTAEAQGTRRPTVMDALWRDLALRTGCILVRDMDRRCWVYIGRQPGPAVAVYLHTYLARCVQGAVALYQTTPAYKRIVPGAPRRQACEAFRLGMVTRLTIALSRHFGAPDGETIAAAIAWSDRLYPDTVPDGVRKVSCRHDAARAAGAAAGAGVELRQAVGGEAHFRAGTRGPQRRIGSGS